MNAVLEPPVMGETTASDKNLVQLKPLPKLEKTLKLPPSPPGLPPLSPPSESPLFEKAVCLGLSLHKLGNKRKLPLALVEVDADKEMISAHKTLLACEQLRAVDHYDGEIRRYLYTKCLPAMFQAGVYLVPIDSVMEVEEKLAGFAGKRLQLVQAFKEAYPILIQEVSSKLRAAFNPKDYPPEETLDQAFRMEWRYVAFSVPGTLCSISKDLFCKEREKAELQWQEALEEVRTLLRTHLSELVSHLVSRLETGKDGKPKVFKNTLVTNLTQFLESFETRNITDDKQLSAIVAEAKDLLNGVDAQTLRTSQAFRGSLVAQFSNLKETLDTLVIVKPTRAFSFDDE